MDEFRAVIEGLASLPCPGCGRPLTRRSIGKVEAAPHGCVVHIICTTCGSASLALVDVNGPAREARDPITNDDVLDAHEALRSYDGDVSGLFSDRAASRR